MKQLAVIFCLLSAFTLSAQRNIFDGFDNNENGWPESMADGNAVFVKDGRYNVASKGEGYFRHAFNIKGGFEQHFRIEISVERDSTVSADNGVGIVWGRADHDSTYMAFLVYGDGSFIFENKVKGKLNVVSPNSFNYAYGEGANSIRVERNMTSNHYDFSINEQRVLSVPYTAPLSDEAGIHLDLAGNYSLDYFWFIEQADAADAHKPAALSMNDRCGPSDLLYASDYGYSFCVPFGWRVDEYKETHQTVWPCGFPYVINIDYTKLAIEDSFRIAAYNDWKIFTDSLDVKERYTPTFARSTAQSGVQVFEGVYAYVQPDGNSMTCYRYYVYNASSGGFMLIECILPPWEETLAMQFHLAAGTIAESVKWE
jgi:hypothetical protein